MNEPYGILTNLREVVKAIPNRFLFDYKLGDLFNAKFDYYVLDTDYDSYSVNYVCGKDENIFIYSRNRTIDKNLIKKIQQKFGAIPSFNLLVPSDQVDCEMFNL
jgi:hypothetical protein